MRLQRRRGGKALNADGHGSNGKEEANLGTAEFYNPSTDAFEHIAGEPQVVGGENPAAALIREEKC
ncbi:MAG TPA: hypothetical protein VKU89_03095 [Solirubrobacteraceae bacterium]|nr:hypothetical protein [Solirubrobacteraceae bacterium]